MKCECVSKTKYVENFKGWKKIQLKNYLHSKTCYTNLNWNYVVCERGKRKRSACSSSCSRCLKEHMPRKHFIEDIA